MQIAGDSDRNARIMRYEWVLHIRQQCINHQIPFVFRQLGTYFEKDGKTYKLKVNDLCKQAKMANINYSPKK